MIAAAEPTNRFVRIDMEDSSTTDDTLRLYRELRDKGHARVGPVLQASLKRTVADAEALAGGSVRLCKGIYIEPESIQFRDDARVRGSFVRSLEILLDGGSYAAIATHDEWLVDEAARLIRERGLTPDRYEFQMLLGVRPELGDRIVADGHRLRIYVPFGSQWPSTRCGGCRRTRRSPATSPATSAIVVPAGVSAYGGGGGPGATSSSSTTVVRRGAAGVTVRAGPPSTYSARRRKPPQLDQKIIEITSPSRPTIIRITPTALTSRPSASAVTPQVRIAPTAINRMLTEIPMGGPARTCRALSAGLLGGQHEVPRDMCILARPLLQAAELEPGAGDRRDELSEPDRREVVAAPAAEGVERGRGGVLVVEQEDAPGRSAAATPPAKGSAARSRRNEP